MAVLLWLSFVGILLKQYCHTQYWCDSCNSVFQDDLEEMPNIHKGTYLDNCIVEWNTIDGSMQ